MQIPIIPFRGQKKPWNSIPRINWHHPLTYGLKFYAYDTGGGCLVDLVGGDKSILITSNTITTGVSPFGNGIKYTIGSGGHGFPLIGAQQGTLTAPYSMATGFFPTSVNAAQGNIFSLGDSGGANAPFVLGPNGSATVAAYLYGNASFSTPTVPNMLNKFNVMVGVAVATNTENNYFNAVLASTSTIASNTSLTGCNYLFNNGSNNSSAFSALTGWIYFGGFWNRALSPAEAAILYYDPYCFLIYPEDEISASLVGVTAFTPNAAGTDLEELGVFRKYSVIGY